MSATDWQSLGDPNAVEVLDYGLWIDGEMFSEKDEMEGTTHGTDA